MWGHELYLYLRVARYMEEEGRMVGNSEIVIMGTG